MKAAIGNIAKIAGEAIIKPVADEAKQVVEEAGQSLFGGGQGGNQPATLQQQQQQQLVKQQEAVRKRNVMQFLNQFGVDAQRVEAQKKYMAQQQKQQEVEEGQKVKQFEVIKKDRKNEALYKAQRKAELKRGGG